MTDLTAERTRKLAAEAQLAEMELAKARHEYVAVADVAGAWSEVLSAVRGRLLSMPTTLATIVANENEVARCQAIIETYDSLLVSFYSAAKISLIQRLPESEKRSHTSSTATRMFS